MEGHADACCCMHQAMEICRPHCGKPVPSKLPEGTAATLHVLPAHMVLPACYTRSHFVCTQDKYENIGAALVKQVASATNDVAGDGKWG
jgi:hypothetical protein